MEIEHVIIWIAGLIVGAVFGAGSIAKIAIERIKRLDPAGYRKVMGK